MQVGRRALLLAVALATILVTVPAGFAGAQTTWTVDTLQDVVDDADGYLSFREAIAAAAADDSINFTVVGTITLDPALGTLCVSRSITINGPGQDKLTVSGGNAISVFWIGFDLDDTMFPDAVVTVSGLTIADGLASVDSAGGAIFNVCRLTLTNCTLTRNSAMLGGALVTLGPVELTGCTFSDNTASGLESQYGSGLGGAILNVATATLTDCQLTGNTAAQSGGAIMNGFPTANGGSVALTLRECVLRGNTVTHEIVDSYWVGGGGAICNSGSGCTASLTVEDSLLTGNFAFLGGALFNSAYTDSDGEWSIGPPGTATANIVRSTLSDNGSNTDSPVAYGGAILQLSYGDSASHASLTVDSSTLSGNSAATLEGQAVGGALASLGDNDTIVSVKNSTLAGNRVVGPTGVGDAIGGAMALWGGVVTVESSTLSGNLCRTWDGSAADGASGLVNGWGEVAIKNSILANDASGPNLAVSGTDITITSYGNNLSTDGGGGFLTATGDLLNTDPKLGPLADNGGPTWTCALLAGSPAIDTADATDSAGNPVEFDQRGVARPQGGANDIGAFELEPPANLPPVLDVSGAPATGVVGTAVAFNASATDPDGDTLTFSLGADAPAGATIDPATGAFSWTPATGGTFSFDVVVTDANNLTDTETVTVAVSALALSKATVTNNGKTFTVTFMLSNAGATTVTNVAVTAAALGGSATNSNLPLLYGSLKPGASKQCKLQFKGVASGSQSLTINGNCSAGTFFTTQTAPVP